jgi:hypothetical protein
MKKIISAILAASLCIGAAYADQSNTNPKVQFAPQSWYSENQDNIVTIRRSVNDPNSNTPFYVQIYVGGGHQPTIGPIKILRGGMCTGAVVNPSSSIICTLDRSNPIIEFSSTNNDATAGVYQIEIGT